MKPNTALAFILAGLSLWLTAGSRGADPRVRRSAGACAGLVATIGALTLSEYVWDGTWALIDGCSQAYKRPTRRIQAGCPMPPRSASYWSV